MDFPQALIILRRCLLRILIRLSYEAEDGGGAKPATDASRQGHVARGTGRASGPLSDLCRPPGAAGSLSDGRHAGEAG